MKLKLTQKITTLEALQEAIEELKTNDHTRYNFDAVMCWVNSYHTNYESLSEDNFVLYREGLRAGLKAMTQGGSKPNKFTPEDNANLPEFLVENEFRFYLPYCFTDTLVNMTTEKEYGRYEDPFHIRVSNEEPNKISLFLNEKMALADRRTKLKPGRLLSRVLGYTNNETIKSMVTMFEEETKPVVVQLAHNAKEIIRVYEHGPESCMMGKNWTSNNHPVQVYDHEHLCLAYLPKRGYPNRISARAILRTDGDEPTYIRTYGDTAKMEAALSALGIRLAKNGLEGIVFKETRHNGYDTRTTMPYLDGNACYAIGVPEGIKIVKNAEASNHPRSACTDNTVGYIKNPNVIECNFSGNACTPDEVYHIRHSSLRSDDWMIDKRRIADYMHRFVEVHRANRDNEVWLEDGVNPHAVKVEDEYYHRSDLYEFNIIQIMRSCYFKSDPRIEQCAYTKSYGIKKDMIHVGNKYYTRLPENLSQALFLNPSTGNIVKNKRAGMQSINDVYNALAQQFGTPVYTSEALAVYPNISSAVARTISNPTG